MATEKRRGYVIELQSGQPAPTDEALAVEASPVSASAATGDVLLIDGKEIPYVATQEGIRIYYQPPEDNLLSAARSYVDTQREKSE